MQLSGKLLMHFKPFWMPCLHINFFTSTPIPELIAVENFTKRWNGILASQRHPLSDFNMIDSNKWGSRFPFMSLEPHMAVYGVSPVTWGETLSPVWFEARKVLVRRDWNPGIRNEEKKCLSDQKSCFTQEPSFQNFVFFAAAPQISCRTKHLSGIYMLPDFIFLKNLLIGQISSHRWMIGF
jgi:hypothetical protein